MGRPASCAPEISNRRYRWRGWCTINSLPTGTIRSDTSVDAVQRSTPLYTTKGRMAGNLPDDPALSDASSLPPKPGRSTRVCGAPYREHSRTEIREVRAGTAIDRLGTGSARACRQSVAASTLPRTRRALAPAMRSRDRASGRARIRARDPRLPAGGRTSACRPRRVPALSPFIWLWKESASPRRLGQLSSTMATARGRFHGAIGPPHSHTLARAAILHARVATRTRYTPGGSKNKPPATVPPPSRTGWRLATGPAAEFLAGCSCRIMARQELTDTDVRPT